MIEYLIILTVTAGDRQGTIVRTAHAEPGVATRLALYDWARSQLPADLQGGVTVFFSAEPNRIGGAS